MQAKTFFIVGAAISFGYGFAFLIAPQMVLALYGVAADPGVVLGYRYFAVALIGLGFVCWTMKECNDAAIAQSILIGLGISDVVGIVVSAWASLSGALNGLGWLNVLLYLGLAAWSFTLYRGRTPVAHLAG